MRLKKPGKNTLEAEVQNISKHGIWVFVKGKEYFLDYENFPWFKNAPVDEVFHMQFIHDHHLHWPDLDIDIEVESLDTPEKYPLVFQ